MPFQQGPITRFSSKLKHLSSLIAIIIFGFVPISIAAQPVTPQGQDLEAQAERFQEEYSLEKYMLNRKKEKPSIEVEGEQHKTASGGPTFELMAIHIAGIDIREQEVLSYIWKPYIYKEINMNDLQDIVAHIKRMFKNAGFYTFMVYLPPQDIKNGIVEIKVLRGKLGVLSIEGNKWFKDSYIRPYFHQGEGEDLDFNKIEKDMVRLNENPDLTVKTILSQGQEPGTTDVALKVSENNPIHVVLGYDNQGTYLTGRSEETAMFNSSNLTGHGDIMSLTTIYSSLASGESMAYRLPVGTNGLKAGVDLGYFENKLGKYLKSFDIRGNTRTYTPNLSGELYVSEALQVNYHLGLRMNDIDKKTGDQKTTEESLREPYFGIDVTEIDAAGQTTFAPELSFGTSGFLGSSAADNPLASRTGDGGFFVKYDHSLNRTQKMPWDSQLQIKSQLQAASHTLPSSDQLQLGGVSSIRGYPEGDYLADVGGDMSMDWSFPMYFIPDYWRINGSDVNLRHQIEPVIFLDMGGGHILQPLPGEESYKFLAGAGGGLQIHLMHNGELDLYWAEHFGDKPTRGSGPSTFYVSVRIGT